MNPTGVCMLPEVRTWKMVQRSWQQTKELVSPRIFSSSCTCSDYVRDFYYFSQTVFPWRTPHLLCNNLDDTKGTANPNAYHIFPELKTDLVAFFFFLTVVSC